MKETTGIPTVRAFSPSGSLRRLSPPLFLADWSTCQSTAMKGRLRRPRVVRLLHEHVVGRELELLAPSQATAGRALRGQTPPLRERGCQLFAKAHDLEGVGCVPSRVYSTVSCTRRPLRRLTGAAVPLREGLTAGQRSGSRSACCALNTPSRWPHRRRAAERLGAFADCPGGPGLSAHEVEKAPVDVPAQDVLVAEHGSVEVPSDLLEVVSRPVAAFGALLAPHAGRDVLLDEVTQHHGTG